MFYGTRAALHLKTQRMSLQKQHAELLAVLDQSSAQTQSEDVSQRIESLRSALKTAMVDSIQVSTTLTERMYVLNLVGIADALKANMRLHVVIGDVTKTLDRLRLEETKSAKKQSAC